MRIADIAPFIPDAAFLIFQKIDTALRLMSSNTKGKR